MTQITTPFAGTEGPSVRLDRIRAVYDAYFGAGALATAGFLGQPATDNINSLLLPAGQPIITQGQPFETWLQRFNLLNSPSALGQAMLNTIPNSQYFPVTTGTVFSDEAGVTAAVIGGPVGALRDAGGTLRATATGTGRPTFGRHPANGINNILAANTTDITAGAGWSGIRVGVAGAATIAGEPATRVTATETNVNGSARLVLQTLAAGTYRLSFVVRGTGFVALRPTDDANFADAVQGWFNLATGAVGGVNATSGSSKITSPVAAITPVGDGYRVSLTFTVTTSTPVSLRLYVTDANASLAVTSGAFVDVEAPQLVAGSTELAYQRRVSAFDVTEAGQRNVFSLAPDGIDDFLSLATPFAPTGGYTILAAGLWATGSPALLPFGSVAGLSNVNMGNGVGVLANTTANQINFPATAGWPSLATGARRVDVIRVDSASAGQAWRNNTPYPASPVVTGNATPVAGLDTMFRSGGSYSGTRLIAAVAVPSAITDAQRLAMQRVLACLSGATLA
jgi:hypothetical protein